MKDKYVAYYSADGGFETFETFKEAEEWLQEYDNQDGISEETTRGLNYIAKITHVSEYEVTARKENYHEHTEECPEDCDEEEWPYDSDFECVGIVKYVEVAE